MNKIFTIGHSNHEIDYFINLLNQNNIDFVIDVRSVPQSNYNPHFGRAPLIKTLNKHKMKYVHFKNQFGARQTDNKYYNEAQQVDFEKFRQSDAFKSGIERIKLALSKNITIALMCSEGNPLDCHRFSMISVYLDNNGFEVCHIMKNGSLMKHKNLEPHLFDMFEKKIPKSDLFTTITDEERLKIAYELHNKKIGWSPKLEWRNK